MKILPGLLVLFAFCAVNAQEITFTFNPPEIKYKEIMKTNQITLVNGKQEKEDEISLTSTIEFKKNNKGYTYYQNPIIMNSKRNGQNFDNPIFMFLTRMPTTTEIDLNGKFVFITGYENLMFRAKIELSKEVSDAMLLVANEEAMVNKAKAEWNARIADFAGQTIQLGDMFSGEGKFPLPNGETLTFFSVVKVADTVTYDGHKCVKIEFRNNSQPEELAAFMGYSAEEIPEVFNSSVNKDLSTNILLSGNGERIMDPATMMIYYEKTFRRIEMQSEVLGDESKNTITLETKEYNYDFSVPDKDTDSKEE